MGFFVPETMKKMNNWIVQKNKKPYSVVLKDWGGHTTKEAWTSYEHATSALKGGFFDGLGFCFHESDRLTFIDLDHCIGEDGIMSDMAEEVLNMFHDSYTEVSQSETGLHIICRGTIQAAVKRSEIEIYSCGHYMAFTGNALTAAEPAEHQKELDILFSRYGRQEEPAERTQNAFRATETATVEEVINCILKSRQGAKFARLHAGQWEGWTYKSQSEAEMAYFSIVNYFTGGNDELTAAVFAASRLSERQKGQRADYIQRTISKAKATATGSTGNRGRRERMKTAEVEIFENPKRRRVKV